MSKKHWLPAMAVLLAGCGGGSDSGSAYDGWYRLETMAVTANDSVGDPCVTFSGDIDLWSDQWGTTGIGSSGVVDSAGYSYDANGHYDLGTGDLHFVLSSGSRRVEIIGIVDESGRWDDSAGCYGRWALVKEESEWWWWPSSTAADSAGAPGEGAEAGR